MLEEITEKTAGESVVPFELEGRPVRDLDLFEHPELCGNPRRDIDKQVPATVAEMIQQSADQQPQSE
jgi:hypothetical protein